MKQLDDFISSRLQSGLHAVLLILLTFLIAPAAQAQVVNATLTGTVKDSSGAVIAGSKVVATNMGTNLTHETATDSQGNYRLPSLPPGRYKVQAEMQGFKTSVISGIVLQVAQQARVDVELQLGEVTQTIDVVGTAPVIDTESPTIGSVVDQKKVVELPLNGRNFMELALLSQGINEAGNSTAKGGFLRKGFAPSAAGMPTTENNYQLDGADNKEGFFNTFNVAPSVDAVQEFKIQIGQYSAEFGSGGGAVINVVTKSGTNDFHGTLWEFIRNDKLDARNFFLSPTTRKAALRRNQFGVAGGGPIKKNRTFFFGNYDGTRERRGVFRGARVPTAAELSGNLASLGKTIMDPVTKLPFPNNVIPANRIDPISAGLAKYYEAPNNPSGTVQNYVANLSSRDDADSFLFRVDHRFSSKHDLMSRYALQDREIYTPGTFTRVGGTAIPQRFQNIVLGLTSTLTPNLLNEARVSFGRTVNRQQGQTTGNPIAADLGIPFAPRDPINSGFPEGIGLGTTAISGIGEGKPWFLTVNSFQWYDGITWTRAAHAIKAGADIRRVRSDAFLATRQNNSYTFNGQFTRDGFADFLLGIPSSSSLALKPNDPARFRRTQMAYYVLDDWKVNSKLTLNIGLRYEFNQIPRELSGLTPIFDPSLGNGAGGLRYPSQNTNARPFFEQIRPDLAYGILDRETQYLPDKNNFAPRFGLAFRPFNNNRTVIRGGYGIYYSSSQLANISQNSVTGPPAQLWAGFTSDTITPTLNYGGDIGKTPEETFRTVRLGLLTGFENQWLEAYTQQWSLSVGQEIGRDFVVEAQYLGSKSAHVENIFDYNYTRPGTTALATRLPFPKYDRIAGFSSGAAANYNALLLSAERRFSDGLSFKGSYTFAKALTINGGRRANGNITQVQDSGNLRPEKGSAADDIRQRFVYNWVYELPWGQGKAWGSNMNPIADKILGGWSVSGIATFRTGLYLDTLVASANCNASPFGICRADLNSDPYRNSNGVDSPKFNVNAFNWPRKTAPFAAPRFGTAAVNALQGNGINTWDMAVLKNVAWGDSYRIQFRWELFNAFNHASFGQPISAPDNPNFGRVTSTAIGPREMQFGLKFYW
jgi:hypothetical protein